MIRFRYLPPYFERDPQLSEKSWKERRSDSKRYKILTNFFLLQVKTVGAMALFGLAAIDASFWFFRSDVRPVDILVRFRRFNFDEEYV